MSETRKLAAILVADVVGYSRLAGTDEDRTLARLRGLRSDLIDPAIAAHRGRIVKRTGDGSIIEFRSVVDAVRCAIEIQNGLLERNAGVPEDRRIEFRVGIHVGDVVEESDGDLMGDGVNIAARLEGIAKPGAICLSEDAYRQVSGRLEMEVTDLGPTQLKNIDRPIRAYSLQVGVPAKPKPRDECEPLRTENAFRVCAACRRARGAAGCDRGRRVVVPRCEPVRKRRHESARRGRAAFDSRAALRQPLGRSGAGLPRRRPDRRTDHQPRAHARHLRHRAQHGHDLQGQTSRRQGDRQGSGRALCSRRLGAAERRSDEGQRPAHRRRQRRSPLGRTIRHAPRRSVADAGRNRHASGAIDATATDRGRRRPSQAHARGQSQRRGSGAPMRGRSEQGRVHRQGSGCGIRALRTGARHRSQQCPRPAGIGGQVLDVGAAWRFQRP